VASAASVRDVHFLSRHACHWGDFGHVRATLKGIRQLLSNEIPFDYAILLTGQDYPVRSPREIESFLAKADGQSFMHHWPLPYPLWDGRGGLDRLESWHFIRYRRRLHVRVPLRRRLPGGLRPYGGTPYWVLSRAVIEWIDNFVAHNPRFVRFFEHVFVPDELFFQTLVMNSPLGDSVVDDDLRYTDWERMPAPAILGQDDLPKLLESNALIARKFDPTVDSKVLDLLDAHLDRALLPAQ
jgi:Core-2/I-Branching enzyme